MRGLSLFRICAVLLVAVTVFVAAPASAATKAKPVAKRTGYDLYNPRRTYGDEKKEIQNPTSRCNTPALKAQHRANVVRAEKDAESFQMATNTRVAVLYDTYLKKLELAWEAMEEPYCGFGAFGATAAKKSYDKSVARTRNEFLTEARKTLVAVQKTK